GAGLFHLSSAQGAAMRAVSAHFRSCQQNLEAEVRFDLAAEALQRIAEKLLDTPAAEADYVGVLLLGPRLVIVLVAAVVHQGELVDQAAFLQQFQRAVDCDAVELGILLLGHPEQVFRVQVLAGFVDQLEQNLALAGEPDTFIPERSADAVESHSVPSFYLGEAHYPQFCPKSTRTFPGSN